jgi:hypothetical protein
MGWAATMSSGGRLTSQNQKDREKKAKTDLLVEKEIQNDVSGTGDEPLGRDALHGLDLRAELIDGELSSIQSFIREFVQPALRLRIQAGMRHLYVALEGAYDLNEVGRAALRERQTVILFALGGSPNVTGKESPESFQKELLKILFAVPASEAVGSKRRKKAQNLLSTYGRSFDGARIEGVRPGRLARAYRTGGGIEAFAEIARADDRRIKHDAEVAAGIKPIEVEKAPKHTGRAKRADPRIGRRGPPKAVSLRISSTTETDGTTLIEIDAAIAAKFGQAVGKVVCVMDKDQIPPLVLKCWSPPAEPSRSRIKKLGKLIYDELSLEDEDVEVEARDSSDDEEDGE